MPTKLILVQFFASISVKKHRQHQLGRKIFRFLENWAPWGTSPNKKDIWVLVREVHPPHHKVRNPHDYLPSLFGTLNNLLGWSIAIVVIYSTHPNDLAASIIRHNGSFVASDSQNSINMNHMWLYFIILSWHTIYCITKHMCEARKIRCCLWAGTREEMVGLNCSAVNWALADNLSELNPIMLTLRVVTI